MIRDDMIFHNVAETKFDEEIGGYRLFRIPEDVIMKLNPEKPDGFDFSMRENYKCLAGVELRFVMIDDEVVIKTYCTKTSRFSA